jgi:hypothetical protein
MSLQLIEKKCFIVKPVGWWIAPVPMARDRRPQLRDLDGEIPMGYAQVGLSAARWVAAVAFVFCVVNQSQAQTVNLSGRYQCAEAKVRGKVIPCKAAPLILKNDGRFELRGWEGSYLVSGEWVELSDSLIKTRAKIEPGHKIVLRYYGKHGLVEMTYERRVAEMGKTALS